MSESNKDLKRLRAIRSGNRGVVTKYTKEAIELLTQGDETNKDRLRTIANLLNEKIIRLKELDAQVLELCEIDDIEREIEETEEMFSRVSDVSRRIEKFTSATSKIIDKPVSITSQPSEINTDVVSNGETSQSNDEQPQVETPNNHESIEVEASANTNASAVQQASTIKLPKLVLPKFKGDITNYRTFWESFESAVHRNSYLTNIDKFNYLLSLLEGNALRAIKGLAVTADNYQSAIDLLRERFGKSQQIISAHMDELLKLAPCVGEKSSQLRFVYDKVSVNVRGLEALGVQPDQYGSLLIPVIMSKLPADVRLEIARKSVKEVWEIKELLEIIRKEVEARELSDHVKADNEKKIKPPPRFPSTTTSLAAQGRDGKQFGAIKCAYCGGMHYSASCESKVKPSERKEILRRDNRCFVCLQVGHRANQCHPSKRCRRCEGRHHQSICERIVANFPTTSGKDKDGDLKSLTKDSKVTTKDELPDSSGRKGSTVTACQNSTTATTRAKCKVFLQTATAYAYSKVDDDVIPVRVLMDGGSQRSYVTESLKERLGLSSERTEVLNLNTFGDDRFVKQRCDRVRVELQGKSKDIEIAALCYPKICSPLSTTLDLDRHAHLQGLELADESLVNDSDSARNIDILIGADYYFDIITDEIRRGDGGPVAVNSEFGWMISGSGYAKTPTRDVTTTQLTIQQTDPASMLDPLDNAGDEGLTRAVQRFWDTESLGIFEPHPSPEKDILRDLKFDDEQGRYQVSLPWKDDRLPTTNGYFSCLKRLRQLHSRLKTDPKLFQQYDNVIQEQVKSCVIEQVPGCSASDESTHFLPHHGVIREDKATTKVRVVFDGSAKHGTTSSLNDCLEKGPNLVPHLFDVVVKFRGYPVGIVADVEKAFHQVEISPDDRRMLRFLWFDDIHKEQPDIVEYQFCRLVFGLTPSPAILNSVIQRHLASYKTKEPELVSLLQDSFYVDDLVGGAWEDDQALEIHEKANNIMASGGFKLRKWNSNSTVLRTRIASEPERNKIDETVLTAVEPLGSKQDVSTHSKEKTNQTERISDEANDVWSERTEADDDQSKAECSIKILGLNWDVETDEIHYDLTALMNFAATLNPTKRSVLRLAAKVFDPLGFLTPFTISMKVLFQTLCVRGVHWDDMLDGEALAAWKGFIVDLSALNNIRIPRCYFRKTKEKPIGYQLHGFSDASSKAYAAVVYLRTVHHNGEIEVNLVASKTRVAPIKKQSIPRLELLGATILARLMNSVRKALTSLHTTPEVFCWTDSYTVLCWIRNEKIWKSYVNHRVQEIRELVEKESWRFCPGEQNPADLPSRGSRGSELTKNTTWWDGPEFIRCTDESWPSEPGPTQSDELKAFAEITKPKTEPTITRALTNVTNTPPNVEAIMNCNRYSSKEKLLRVTALVKKFGDKTRKRPVPAEITAKELKAAERIWVNAIQASNFKEERLYLQGVSKSKPQLVKQLNLFLDEEGTIRCQGRIDESSLPMTAKRPILLPSRHFYTQLVIRNCHEVVHHNGVKETLNCIREVYWIPRGREAVKRVIGVCVVCKKHEGKPCAAPKFAPLPSCRVSEDPPFAHTGMDFAGPLYLTAESEVVEERKLHKAYICLYTCASTRALHLELVPNLSVSTFLQSFRRFTARRGLPTKLLSDNAKTFKAAAKEVKGIVRSVEVQRYFASKGITWDFIVEKAPWQGGFWERMVKCVKRCLKKVVGRSSLSFEEMRTLLIEVEATLNNRPMTYVYDDEEGVSYPLTPAKLIYGRNIATTPNDKQFEVISTNQSLTRRQQYHKRLLNQFIKQWRTEYLTSLRESSRSKVSLNATVKCAIEVGEIVVLKNDKSSRSFWNLGKVEELILSKDGVVRAARVRVVNQESGKSSCLRRPIQHLVPLEIRSCCKQKNEDDGREQTVKTAKEDSITGETQTPKPSAVVTKYFLRSKNNRKETV